MTNGDGDTSADLLPPGQNLKAPIDVKRPKSSLKPKRKACTLGLLVIGALVLILALAGLIVSTSLYLSNEYAAEYQYGIVFDAGSSHTSAYFYKWVNQRPVGATKVEQLDSCDAKGPNKKAYEGISSLVSHNEEQKVRHSISSCLLKATAVIPKEELKNTIVLLGATAGMRLLNVTNCNNVKRAWALVRDEFQKSGFKITDLKHQVRILSGLTEGLSAWLSANFILGGIDGTIKRNQLIGAMDMGGASMQISFVSNSETATDLTIYGTKLKVFSKSFLCAGAKRFQIIYLQQLVISQEDENLNDWCLPKGFSVMNKTVSYTMAYLFNQTICSSEKFHTQKFESCGGIPELKRQPAVYHLNGQSDYRQCGATIDTILNGVSLGVPKLPDIPFMALSSFYYAIDYLRKFSDVPKTTSKFTLAEYEVMLQKFCEATWEQITKKLEITSERKSAYVQPTCFRGNYIMKILLKLGFSEKNWAEIDFQRRVNNKDVEWALGYMMQETALIPIDIGDVNLEPDTYTAVTAVQLLGLLIAVVLLAAAVYLVYRRRQASRSRNDPGQAELLAVTA